MDIDRTESRGTPVKKLVLAAVAGTGLLLGTAGSTLAHPGDPYFPQLVTAAARSQEEGIPPNPIAPVTNRGSFIASVATTFNPSNVNDPT